MKNPIITSSALVIFLSTSAMAGSSVSIEQIGVQNSVKVDILGENTGSIKQIGDFGVAGISQKGGTNNNAEILQDGRGGAAFIQQEGKGNIATIQQKDIKGNDYQHDARQGGENNIMEISIIGGESRGNIGQFGADNNYKGVSINSSDTTVYTQAGDRNTATIENINSGNSYIGGYVFGNDNQLTISNSGANSGITNNTQGNANTVDITNSGFGSNLQAYQFGNNNSIKMNNSQMGNSIITNQVGNGNIASVNAR